MFFRTLLVWAAGLPLTIATFLLILPCALADKSGNSVHVIISLWSRMILAISGVRVLVSGVENIPRDRPVVILSNHQGAFDIPLLQGYIPVQFRWVAKKSLFKIPIVGWSMSLAGYIAIERERASKAFRSIDAAARKIASGTSVLVFPEGTRSATGELLPFKKGAFLLVSKSGAPIVPVAVSGTKDIMKKGSLRISSATVSITIGKPFETAGLGEGALLSRTREAIGEMFSHAPHGALNA